ncbi:hypothetical protein Q5752_003396 [Cryptotrichosporon argae]
MFTPKKTSTPAPPPPAAAELSVVQATALAAEFASLRAPGACPRGMYVVPSPDSLRVWHGVLFVHRGPYAGSVLRFTLIFPPSFPGHAPTVRFDTDVFHPLIDPKTHVWSLPSQPAWHPDRHVAHLLHALKASFKTPGLDAVGEDEAANRQVWSLYRHSPQTFLSLTAQRAMHSTTRAALFGEPLLPAGKVGSGAGAPGTPGTPGTQKTRVDEGRDEVIRFSPITDPDGLWDAARRSLGA